MTIRLATTARNAATDAVVDLLDAGSGPATIKLYTGAQPGSAQDAATGTLLATVTLADPAFGAASSGSATLTDAAAVTAAASGAAGWFRAADSDGNTVFDGSVSNTSGSGDLKLSTVDIVAGGSVDLTGGTYSTPAG